MESKRVIARDELAVLVEVPEVEGAVRIILGGRGVKPSEGGFDVGGGRVVGEKGLCELILRSGITRFGLRLDRG